MKKIEKLEKQTARLERANKLMKLGVYGLAGFILEKEGFYGLAMDCYKAGGEGWRANWQKLAIKGILEEETL